MVLINFEESETFIVKIKHVTSENNLRTPSCNPLPLTEDLRFKSANNECVIAQSLTSLRIISMPSSLTAVM